MPIEPADRIVSRADSAIHSRPPPMNSTPLQRTPAAVFSMRSRRTWLPVMTVRLPRASAGFRNALAVFQRIPRFWLTSK